jgi:hypothetical protein
MDIHRTLALQRLWNVSIMEIIKHDHTIHNMDHKSAFMEISIIISGHNAKYQQKCYKIHV